MTVEWYDLGQRLRAAADTRAVPRLSRSPISPTACPVAVRAYRQNDTITVATANPGQPPATGTGPQALDLLGSLGVTLTAPIAATLVTDQPGTMALLHRLARSAEPGSDLDTVAAHIAWWRDRSDFPGGRAVVDTITACRTRWVTGTAPAAENEPATWRHWLGMPDDSTTGLLDLHTRLTAAPPLDYLDVLAESDEWHYRFAQTQHSDGVDWRRPDSTYRAAMGLRARCDAADLYAAALLTDPLYRHRAVHTGDVVTGTAHPTPDALRRMEVTCARLDARLRPGADLTGWTGTPTHSQAAEIAYRLGALACPARLAWPKGQPGPDLTAGTATIARGSTIRYPDTGGGVVIATTARWLYADPTTLACDLMIVDEAWQATYADLGALGAFAPQLVCVGDPGQIPPVVTGQTRRWDNSATRPHLPAPIALLAAHPAACSVVTLRHTWRLGPTTTALIQPALYPDLPFTSRRPPEHLTHPDSTPLPEITAHPVTATGPTDPALIDACAAAARTLLTTTLTTPDTTRPLTDHDLAVVAPHVSQAAAIRAHLSDLTHVLVGTANQLQGMERPAAVVLHPLAGYRDPTTFATDLGRACVMFTRHRAHLHVITDPATPAVLAAAQPDPAITTHRTLLNHLHSH